MPRHGYTRMFENMLAHPNIKIMLNTDYREVRKMIPCREIIYTGPVDEYFDYRYGKLPYRSLEFRHETLDEERHLPVAVVNYPNDHAYTRVTEFKHLTGQDASQDEHRLRIPARRGRPVLPHPQARMHGAVQQVQGAGRRGARRPLRRAAGDLQILQHGSSGGSGAGDLRQDCGDAAGTHRRRRPVADGRSRQRAGRPGRLSDRAGEDQEQQCAGEKRMSDASGPLGRSGMYL